MKIKYMGSSDVRVISKGDDFNGRLPGGLEARVEFSRDNRFVVDTSELGLSQEAVDLLLTDDEMKDVSDLKRVPSNLNEKIFGGIVDPEDAAPVTSDGSPAPDAKVSPGAASGRPVGRAAGAAGTS